jgi:hypothetical protein
VQTALLRDKMFTKISSQQLLFLSSHPFKCPPGKTLLNFYAIGQASGEWRGDHCDAMVHFHGDGQEEASMRKGVSQQEGGYQFSLAWKIIQTIKQQRGPHKHVLSTDPMLDGGIATATP